MQLSNLMVAIKQIEANLSADLTVEQKISLNNTYDKFQSNANVKIARIESLENSLVGLEKTKADTERSIVLTRKAQLEADKLSRELGGSATPLSEIYDEILAMGSDGMMNQ
ncbi:MAG: cell division protein DivIVA, partial [Psychromonas sp.]